MDERDDPGTKGRLREGQKPGRVFPVLGVSLRWVLQLRTRLFATHRTHDLYVRSANRQIVWRWREPSAKHKKKKSRLLHGTVHREVWRDDVK